MEETDNALKKFYKSVLTKFQEEHSAVFSSSNIADVLEQLPWDNNELFIFINLHPNNKFYPYNYLNKVN